MDLISKKDLKELLNKCWMTHDAMWFAHCLMECGIEKTNKINKAAVRSMALIEVKRVAKALGHTKIETFEDFKDFFAQAYDLILPDFMDFDYSFPEENVVRADWRRCFAYEGVRRIGAIDQYQCGIFERIEAWLDGMGIKYTVTPTVNGCMMHTDGNCHREYRVSLQ